MWRANPGQGAAFAPIYLLYLPRGDPQKSTSISRKIAQLDFLGIVLNIGAFTALILAISFGGTEYTWSDGREIALWVVGGALLAIFAVQQGLSIGTTKARRTFPVDFLRKKILVILFCLMNAAATCVFVSSPISRPSETASPLTRVNTISDSHFLHPPLLPVRPWRLPTHSCGPTVAIYRHHGFLWTSQRRPDEQIRLLHAMVCLRRHFYYHWR